MIETVLDSAWMLYLMRVFFWREVGALGFTTLWVIIDDIEGSPLWGIIDDIDD